MRQPEIFPSPLYVTKPALPPIENIHSHLEEIWKSGILTNHGPKYRLLESRLKQLLEAKNIKLFSNGTLGLMLAIKALDIKGEVITTPFTFPATPHAISWAGAVPVFADIDEDTLCIDPEAIESMVCPDTEAILGVHVFGIPCDVYSIRDIAARHKLKVIYDGAHVFHTMVDGEPISKFGDATMFSFHATKLFHTIEGGCVVINQPTIADKLELLRNFGIRDERNVLELGINAKLNEFQCAVGLEMLGILEIEREKRSRIKGRYLACIAEIDGLEPLSPPVSCTDSYQYMAVKIKERILGLNADELYEELKEFNIFSRRYFFPLCTNYPYYENSKKSAMPIAENIIHQVLCLPFHGNLLEADIEKIVSIIKYISSRKK